MTFWKYGTFCSLSTTSIDRIDVSENCLHWQCTYTKRCRNESKQLRKYKGKYKRRKWTFCRSEETMHRLYNQCELTWISLSCSKQIIYNYVTLCAQSCDSRAIIVVGRHRWPSRRSTPVCLPAIRWRR